MQATQQCTQGHTGKSDSAIQVENIEKNFQIYQHPRERLLAALPWSATKNRARSFTALKGISFTLAKGQTMGIVGKNGSGKSTLLQIITGTLLPSAGSVHTTGRIGALLELGSGFNPEFTGLENIYFNGLILGLGRKEIEAKLDAILSFADIGDFVHQPVKTYSSGMAVRLAFAVQANCDPEILVVDEALAVGDELFQKKCHQHLETLKDRGTSILLVTHSCTQINQQCDVAMLLHHGECLQIGKPQEITFLYQQLLNQASDDWQEVIRTQQQEPSTQAEDSTAEKSREGELSHATPLNSQSAMAYTSHGIEIVQVEVLNSTGAASSFLVRGEAFQLRFTYASEQEFEDAVFTSYITSHTGIHVSGQSLPDTSDTGIAIEARQRFTITFNFEGRLWPGLYFVGGGIASPSSGYRFVHRVVDWAVFRVVDTTTLRSHGAAQLSADAPRLAPLVQD